MKKQSIRRDSFVFYRSFYESIVKCPDEAQIALFRGIVEYALDQVDPDFSGTPNQPFIEAIWTGIKPQLAANHKRYLNGCSGGAPAGNRNNPNGRKGKTNQEPTKNQPNENVNDNDNENVNVGKRKALKLPFPDDKEFVDTWNMLRSQPKWKKKSVSALQLSLDKLADYDPRFGVELMKTAIERDWAGVVFPQTVVQYKEWKRIAGMTTDSRIVTVDDYFKEG